MPEARDSAAVQMARKLQGGEDVDDREFDFRETA